MVAIETQDVEINILCVFFSSTSKLNSFKLCALPNLVKRQSRLVKANINTHRTTVLQFSLGDKIHPKFLVEYVFFAVFRSLISLIREYLTPSINKHQLDEARCHLTKVEKLCNI